MLINPDFLSPIQSSLHLVTSMIVWKKKNNHYYPYLTNETPGENRGADIRWRVSQMSRCPLRASLRSAGLVFFNIASVEFRGKDPHKMC